MRRFFVALLCAAVLLAGGGLSFAAEAGRAKADATYAEGIRKYQAGDLEGALQCWNAALSLYRKVPDTEIRQAQCLIGMGGAEDELGRSREAVGSYRTALKILMDFEGTEYLQALCLMNMGVAQTALGEHREAVESLRAAVALAETLPEAQDVQAKCRLDLGVALSEMGRNGEAMKEYGLALGLFRTLPDTAREQATCLMDMGTALEGPDAEHRALALFDEALALFESVPGTEADRAECLMNKGVALRRQWKLQESRQVLERSLQIGGAGRRRAICLMHYGFVLDDLGQLEGALAAFEESLAALRSFAGTELHQARCISHLGIVLNRLGKVKEAMARYEEALGMLKSVKGSEKDTASCLADMGVASADLGETGRALDYYREALAAFRRLPGAERDQADCLANIGIAMRVLGRSDEAVAHGADALAIYRRLPGAQLAVADCLVNLGVAVGDEGRLEEAVKYYEDALDLYRALPGAERKKAGCLMNVGGAMFDLGKLDDAASSLDKALAQCAGLSGMEQTRGSGLINLAVVRCYQQKFDEALRLFDEALAVLKGVQGSEGLQAMCTLNQGSTLMEMGKLDEASGVLERALAGFRTLQGGEFNAGLALTNLGWLRTHRRDFAGAREAFTRALEYTDGWILRLGLARTFEGLAGAGGAGREGALREALEGYRKTLELIEKERGAIKAREYAVSWFNDKVQAYDAFIGFVLGNEGLDLRAAGLGGGSFEAALSLSEGCKARMLSDILQRRKPSPKDEETRKLLDEESTLRLRIDRLHEERETARSRIGDEGAARRVGAINGEIRDVQKRRNIVESALASTGLYELAAPGRERLPEDTRALLDDDTALLEYTLLDDRIVLLVMTKRDSAVYVTPVRIKAARDYPAAALDRQKWFLAAGRLVEESPRELGLEGLVHFYRYPMTSFSDAVMDDWAVHQKAGMALYRLLIPEKLEGLLKERGVRHLAIVPDGALHYLPFSCLPAPGTPSESYDVHYLVQDYAVSCLPSASILAKLRSQHEERRARATPGRDLLAFADPVFTADDERLGSPSGAARADWFVTRYYGERFKLGRLPDTKDEARNVAALFPKERTTVLLGFDASKENALGGSARDYRYILFATHGMMDEQNPDLSCLALSMPPPGKSGAASGAGFLTMEKIFAMDLNADLVVLSACETALGRVARGEGMLGLPLAFFYAGTPSLLASVWKVPSRQTALLSSAFFASLRKGAGKAAALREAQLQLIRSADGPGPYAHPFFWAAFVLDGDWR